MPWSVRDRVRANERAWGKGNKERRRLRFSLIEQELLFAGEHPFRFCLSALFLIILLLVLVGQLPKDWFAPPWYAWGIRWGVADQLSYFSTLWTVQVTLAALVYPIVIAFVAVFLQRRPAAEAFVRLYILDSGALAAGLSSLVLVLVMGVQYLMLTTWGNESLPAWVAVDTGWFLLNAGLTTYFLFRTVDFLQPEVQAQVVRRYTVNVALPRDVERLNSALVFATAQAKGWLPVPSYGDESAEDGPRLLIGPFSFREGEVQGAIRLRERSRLIDVRLWLVRIVVSTWYLKAMKHPQPADTSAFGRRRTWPLLTLPITPGSDYGSEIALARIADGPKLSGWQRSFLRWSLVLRPVSRERYGIRVQAILNELTLDARQAAARGDNETFERAYGALVDMHELLLSACLDKDEAGNPVSWALLRDTHHIFNRALHEVWSDVYRSIYEAAIQNLLANTEPLQRLCHLLQHLEGNPIRSSPVEVQEHLLHLPPLMMYLLGNWWARRVEEQGDMDHGHDHMVILRPPLSRAYEEILSSFVAGWENGRPDSAGRHDVSTLDWTSIPAAARLNAKHIEETARMLLAAVQRGDKAAAEWLADVLTKWWGSFKYENEPYQLYDKTEFMTLDHLYLEWSKFKSLFGLDDAERTDPVVVKLQQGVYLATVRNFWTDIRLLVVEILMSWLHRPGQTPPKESLALQIAAGFLTGKQWRGGGQVTDPLSELSAAEYLAAKIRQYAASAELRGGYVGRLDRFVERVKDMDRPNMVSSRSYSFSGADDVGSLQDAQLAFLALLGQENWSVSRKLQRQLDLWLEEQYPSIQIVRDRLALWLKRAEERPELSNELLAPLRQSVGRGLEASAGWQAMKAAVKAMQEAVESKREGALAAQPIDPERLLEIGRSASSTGFTSSGSEFPMQLVTVDTTHAGLQDFTLTIKQVRRGELTRVEMDQRASNEAEYFSETLARQVAVVVLSDVLRQCSLKEIVTPDASAYWYALKVEAARLAAEGATPILLLDNATRPDWVWDWQHSDYGADFKRPEDLQVHRAEGRGPGYVCDFNQLEVYVAPLPAGQSLILAKETFDRVIFTKYSESRFVEVVAAELPDKKNFVDLKLTFSRHVQIGKTEGVRLVYADGRGK